MLKLVLQSVQSAIQQGSRGPVPSGASHGRGSVPADDAHGDAASSGESGLQLPAATDGQRAGGDGILK